MMQAAKVCVLVLSISLHQTCLDGAMHLGKLMELTDFDTYLSHKGGG